jgi:hypothetical protein
MSLEHLKHILPDRGAGSASPSGRQRQFVHIGRRKPDVMRFFGRRRETSQLVRIHRSLPDLDYFIFLYKPQPIAS